VIKPLEIRHASDVELPDIVSVTVDVLVGQGLFSRMIRDADHRRHALASYLEKLIGFAIKFGEVEITSDYLGIAVWIPCTSDIYRRVDSAVTLPNLFDRNLEPRLLRLQQVVTEMSPGGKTHHWLAFIAVSQGLGRQNLRGELLKYHHEYLDRLGIAGFSVAYSVKERDLLIENGYRAYGLPASYTQQDTLWPMWRQARTISQQLHI
jgi:hypothetical protein